MELARSLSSIGRMATFFLLCPLLISTTLAQDSTRDQQALSATAVDWSGTSLSPSNNAPVGSQLAIRPPAGARLPQVAVQLAGQNLAIVSASPEEVRVQLPSQPVTGALTMTNAATRLTGTLVPEYRVFAAAPSAPSAPVTGWDGAQGPVGPQGDIGPEGPQGPDGAGYVSVLLPFRVTAVCPDPDDAGAVFAGAVSVGANGIIQSVVPTGFATSTWDGSSYTVLFSRPGCIATVTAVSNNQAFATIRQHSPYFEVTIYALP